MANFAKCKTVLMAFYMFFSIYNCTTYFKSQLIVKSITNMQKKKEKISLFSDEIYTPTPTETVISTQ